MTTIALDRVSLVHPLGDMGDRSIQGISTVIASETWHIEADYHHGSVGDVTLYLNKNQHAKDALPHWEWYGAVPTANIKAYRLAGVLPSPAALPSVDGESQATDQTSLPAAAATSGKP